MGVFRSKKPKSSADILAEEQAAQDKLARTALLESEEKRKALRQRQSSITDTSGESISRKALFGQQMSEEETKEAERILRRSANMKTERSTWNSQWQDIGEFVSQTKQNFEDANTQGEYLNDVFDSKGTFAANSASSALLGMLWPSSAAKSIKITPPNSLKNPSKEVTDWFESASELLADAMDNPNANLSLALDEYMLDEVVFGNGGVGVFWEDDGLFYRSFGVMESSIDQSSRGRVNTLKVAYSWAVERIVSTYGLENVSEPVREAYQNEKFNDRFTVIIMYEPDDEEADFPFKATHIEEKAKKILLTEGFDSFPIPFARFRKLSYEKYGRSPAMAALPDIKELNTLREMIIRGTEKNFDPPKGVFNDSIMGGGVIDTSAGSINVFDSAGMSGGLPIFEIGDRVDLNQIYPRIEGLEQSIAQHFAIDRLLDFNNQTQMTATETAQRAQIRQSSLSSILTRQISELFQPVVERSFELMLKNDKLGFPVGSEEARAAEALGQEVVLIPTEIATLLAEGKPSYEVRFTTSADRAASADELEGLLSLTQFMQMLMQSHPEVGQKFDAMKAIEEAREMMGAPSVLSSDEEVNAKQEAQAEQVGQQQGLDQAEQAAGIAEKVANAENNQ